MPSDSTIKAYSIISGETIRKIVFSSTKHIICESPKAMLILVQIHLDLNFSFLRLFVHPLYFSYINKCYYIS